ncbi:MAG: 3-oxoacyl-ACP synthase III [Verrucomicrobia bacterium]|nr:3-oxoacyl-ACP synthase III [Verrucomicrobiota bacterium]
MFAKFTKVRIAGLASVQPPVEITSDAIEQRLQPLYERLRLPTGRLELMTGIHARHFWPDPILPSTAAANAGRLALEQAAIPMNAFGLLAHCGVCRDHLEPATASRVHSLLHLPREIQFLDISNACLGFLNAMILASSFIEGGMIRAALLVSGENGKPLLEHTIRELLSKDLTRNQVKPYFANLTIGAGAAACVLAHEDLAPTSPRFSNAVVHSDSSHNELCQGDNAGDELAMLTDSEALLQAGLDLAADTWARFTALTGWGVPVIDRTVCHQVGRTHQRKLLERLNLSLEKDFTTYRFMGNVGSVSLPFTLDHLLQQNALAANSKIALLGIGSGLSCAMAGIELS